METNNMHNYEESHLDITGQTHKLSIIAKVREKLPEYIDPLHDHKSCFGISVSVAGMSMPFYGYGPNKKEVIQSLNEGDMVQIIFKLKARKPLGKHFNIKLTIHQIKPIRFLNQ